MGGDHGVPVVLRHVEEHALTQDAGDADDPVDPAPGIDRTLHDPFARRHFGDGVGDGDGGAAALANLLHHGVGHLTRGLLAVHAHAEVSHDDVRALGRTVQRHSPADAAPGPGHGNRLSLE